jgi:thymidylate synthase
MYLMKPYDSALEEILSCGVHRTNKRTGIKTLSVFGMMRRYALDNEYHPIVTGRKMFPKSVFGELLWFLSGSTNNHDLINKYNCKFWTPWVDHEFEKKHGYIEGSFGPVYGYQLRHFGGNYGNGGGGNAFSGMHCQLNETKVAGFHESEYEKENVYGKGGFDQLAWVVNRIKEDPSCRRTLWTLWNPQDVHKMKLPPCHMMSQIFVDDDRRLTLLMYQRSCDFPVGVPANIQFYSALAKMIAQQTDTVPHEFVHITGDSHIYADQIDLVGEYLALPKPDSPKLKINKAEDIFSYELKDFELSGMPRDVPKLDFPVAV